MTKSRLKVFRRILNSKRIELARRLRNREAIAIERSPDAFDVMQFSQERDLAVHSLDVETDTFREVLEALERIDGGTYGRCVRCASEIGPKRLLALPWTRFCIQCRTVGSLEYLARNRTPQRSIDS
jgi:DnaK suppressor protein